MFSPKNYVNTLKSKNIVQLVPKFLRTHCSLKILPDFELKGFENFVSSKKCIFCTFSKILKFHFWLNRLVLTKCWLKYFRSIRNLLLIIFIFWIMFVSPKLKKYLMVQTPPKKRPFLGGFCTIKYFFQFWRYDYDSKYEKHQK